MVTRATPQRRTLRGLASPLAPDVDEKVQVQPTEPQYGDSSLHNVAMKVYPRQPAMKFASPTGKGGMNVDNTTSPVPPNTSLLSRIFTPAHNTTAQPHMSDLNETVEDMQVRQLVAMTSPRRNYPLLSTSFSAAPNDDAFLARLITLYGFPLDRVADIVPSFHALGDVVHRGTGTGDWIVIEYATVSAAQCALSWHGEIINGLMIGVKQTQIHEISTLYALEVQQRYSDTLDNDPEGEQNDVAPTGPQSPFNIKRKFNTTQVSSTQEQKQPRQSFCVRLMKLFG